MRDLSNEAEAALEGRRFAVRCMLKADVDGEPFCIWDDAGQIVADGDTYRGAPRRFTVAPAPSAKDQNVRNVDVELSGLDNEAVNIIRTTPWHQRPLLIQRVIIATDAPHVLHVVPEFSGRLDQAIADEDPGQPGTHRVTFRAESAAREFDSRGSQTRDDADQRHRDPDDGFFSAAAAAVNTPIKWGRETARRVGPRS